VGKLVFQATCKCKATKRNWIKHIPHDCQRIPSREIWIQSSLGPCPLGRFTKTLFYLIYQIFVCQISIQKMVQKSFCSNIAPSGSTGVTNIRKSTTVGSKIKVAVDLSSDQRKRGTKPMEQTRAQSDSPVSFFRTLPRRCWRHKKWGRTLPEGLARELPRDERRERKKRKVVGTVSCSLLLFGWIF